VKSPSNGHVKGWHVATAHCQAKRRNTFHR
jgi:hypothetical protein